MHCSPVVTSQKEGLYAHSLLLHKTVSQPQHFFNLICALSILGLCAKIVAMMTEFEQKYLEARRNVVRADFEHLNNMQIEAVMATEGPLLILAGAGSGKTTVLINRIANLLKYGKAGDSDELPADADEEKLAILRKGGEAAQRVAALDRWRPGASLPSPLPIRPPES